MKRSLIWGIVRKQICDLPRVGLPSSPPPTIKMCDKTYITMKNVVGNAVHRKIQKVVFLINKNYIMCILNKINIREIC